MATDLSSTDTPTAAAPAATARPAARKRPHRLRFAVVYVLLAGVLGAAIAGVVLLAGGGIVSHQTAWSSWKPSGGGQGAEKQIAQHVGKAYRLAGGDQLVDVIVKPPQVQDVPLRGIAIRASNGDISGTEITKDNAVMYVLCGLGQSCSIGTGKPTIARGRLVRREALELALYTFKYVGSVKYVIAFMPPKPGSAPQYVVYFQKNDLTQELKQPLVRTLNAKTPLADTITPRETATIDQLTEPHVFKFSLQQAQQGDAILVLAPPSV